MHLSLNEFLATKEKIVGIRAKRFRNVEDSNGPFRDSLRIHQLEADGWIVYSVSQMPFPSPECFSDQHIEAALIKTESERRSFIKILQKRVKITKKPYFDVVSLDYLRMPTDYMRNCFDENFWSNILVDLFVNEYISSQTPIYVSNFEAIEELFGNSQRCVREKGLELGIEPCDVKENPLFRATDKIASKLVQIGDPNTNLSYIASRISRGLSVHMFRVLLSGIYSMMN